MQTSENRRIAGQADFSLVCAFSVEINLARLRRYLAGLKKRDDLKSRARCAAVFARRVKQTNRIKRA